MEQSGISVTHWHGDVAASQKQKLLRNLLNKPLSLDEKVSRIMALEAEEKNADVCDYVVPVTTYADSAIEILDGLFPNRQRRKKKS